MDLFPGEHGGDDARVRRLGALRSLANAAPASASSGDDEPVDSRPAPAVDRLTPASPRRATRAPVAWRRWGGVALVVVVAVVICGVVLGSVAQQSGLSLGAFGAKPAPALVYKVFSLQAAQGTLSCPSTPVWSPNGKQFAVVAQVGPSPDGCNPYNDVTNIQRSDTPGGNGGVTTSGPPPSAFALAIFDAASGHAVRTIKLPALAVSLLCAGANPCVPNPLSDQTGVQAPALQSIGWSPDGRTIGVFFTYVFNSGDFIHYENRGALIIVPVDGSGAPRAFIAKGYVRASSHSITLDAIYGPERYTWDLSTGAGSYASIHRNPSLWTEPFAGGYRLDGRGALSLDQQWRMGDLSPWSAGVFVLNGLQGASQFTVSYQSSQWIWSSDGHFVSPNLNMSAYLALPGLTVAAPVDTAAGSIIIAPNLAPPDAATAQAVKASAQTSSDAALARDPSGALLASYGCAPSGAGLLIIRSVASGKTLAQAPYSYPLTTASLGCAGNLSSIVWSPDGARIVATDSPDGQFIVWRVSNVL